jgi:hypothetical protein
MQTKDREGAEYYSKTIRIWLIMIIGTMDEHPLKLSESFLSFWIQIRSIFCITNSVLIAYFGGYWYGQSRTI